VARRYVNRPTALTFEGNGARDPERQAAAALARQLERRGIRIGGDAGSGRPPKGATPIASVESRPMRVLLARTLRPSWNFAAEVLGKGLGAEVRGAPGTIAKGASAIQGWAADRGAAFTLYDSSGLSYANRVTAAGIVELLTQVEEEPWGAALRRALPAGGQGTLEDRLAGVKVRAKTGSLTGVSTLSGWVFSPSSGSWVEFSILCAGLAKATAVALEDRIVRLLRDAPI
jgi:D-alanyl-D-alanine carboxypeptidase/D-alanyl-D-alanine-endopeptidase (penicillin-binding protein 4)